MTIHSYQVFRKIRAKPGGIYPGEQPHAYEVPRVGFEPTTLRSSAGCFQVTEELPG
jgi:hypothetical protein